MKVEIFIDYKFQIEKNFKCEQFKDVKFKQLQADNVGRNPVILIRLHIFTDISLDKPQANIKFKVNYTTRQYNANK